MFMKSSSKESTDSAQKVNEVIKKTIIHEERMNSINVSHPVLTDGGSTTDAQGEPMACIETVEF